MKGGVGEFTEQEQRLREFIALKRAEFAFKQRIERQRWEQDTLVPEAQKYERQLQAGTAQALELPDGS